MAGTDRHTMTIEHLGDVMCMHSVEHKSDNPYLVFWRWTDQSYSGNFLKNMMSKFGEPFFMLMDLRKRLSTEIFDCGAKSNDLDSRRRACLTLGRRFCSLKPTHVYPPNHATTTKKWRHLFQEAAFGVQDSDTRGCEHFVAAERDKIGIELLHIDRHMWNELRRVDHDEGASRMRARYNLRERINCAQDV